MTVKQSRVKYRVCYPQFHDMWNQANCNNAGWVPAWNNIMEHFENCFPSSRWAKDCKISLQIQIAITKELARFGCKNRWDSDYLTFPTQEQLTAFLLTWG